MWPYVAAKGPGKDNDLSNSASAYTLNPLAQCERIATKPSESSSKLELKSQLEYVECKQI